MIRIGPAIPRISAIGHAASGLMLCASSPFTWFYNEPGPLSYVLPWAPAGYETWSGRLALLAGVALVASAAWDLHRGRLYGRPFIRTAGSILAAAAAVGGLIEVPDTVPLVVYYHLGSGYWVAVAGAALAGLSSAVGLAARSPHMP